MRKRQCFVVCAVAANIWAMSLQPAIAAECSVTFGLDAPHGEVSMLGFNVDYSAVEGTFAGSAERVDCRTLLADTSIMARDNCTASDSNCYFGEGRSIALVLQRALGIAGSTSIVACRFSAPAGKTPPKDAFHAEVNAATSLATDTELSSDLPTVRVIDVQCAN